MNYKLEYKPVGFGPDPDTGKQNQGLSGVFFIPDYQRGYRWTAVEVCKLLDDIAQSANEGKKRYSLQPIVVKGKADGSWEVIDGQQRLTTLWLVFNYMHKEGFKRSGAAYSLKYETRPGSEHYLETLDKRQSEENIDYFHLRAAHDAIDQWLRDKASNDHAKDALVDQIHGYLSRSVHVIWYEVPADEEPIPLFTRLNQGRIPLTDAELLKAVLLSRVQEKRPGRETEIAAQWDGIERDLQRADLWAFVAPPHSRAQQQGTRIDLLLDTLAGKPPTGAHLHHTFDALRVQAEDDGLVFWDQVVALHAQVLGWFEEPHWHNKIGFLVACGRPLAELLQLAQGQRKRDFDAALTARIKATLDTRADELGGVLHYENNGHKAKLQRLLLLFNIEVFRDRFPFKEHVGTAWSLEHIHAQNAQDLVRAEQWETWLREHRQALHDIHTPDNAATIGPLLDRIDAAAAQLHTPRFGLKEFQPLAGQILLALNDGVEEEADHSIANLALLSHGANAALSNAVFEVKRSKVLAMDRRGDYLPAATRNVFLKYYAPADRLQPHFWSAADKAAYLRAIQLTLADYLQ